MDTNSNFFGSIEFAIGALPRNRINLLCPAGTGDFLWIHQKLHAIDNVTYWFPDNEAHRAHEVARLLGKRCGFLPGMSTEWVWAQHGMPVIDGPGVYVVQPNRHLEAGRNLSEWYPDAPAYGKLRLYDLADSFLLRAFNPEYVLAFCSHEGYMEGNLLPAMWANIFKQIEKQFAPVRLCGMRNDIPFANEILKYYQSPFKPVFDEGIEVIMRAAKESHGMIGMASGPMIAAQYCGVPTLSAYPRWLAPMPGTWELDTGDITAACFVDELPEAVAAGRMLDVCSGNAGTNEWDSVSVLSNLRRRGKAVSGQYESVFRPNTEIASASPRFVSVDN